MPSSYSGLVNVSFQNARGIALQDARQRLYELLPKIMIGDARSGVASTSYRLKRINEALKTSRVRQRNPGTQPHLGNPVEADTVTVTPIQYESDAGEILLPAEEADILTSIDEDMALHLDQFELALDNLVLSFLQSTTYFQSSTINGTGALDTFNDDIQPSFSIDVARRIYAPYRALSRFSEEAFIGLEVAKLLARYPDYRNAQYDDRGQRMEGIAAFKAAFMAAHPGVRAVHIIEGGIDEAQDGLSSNPQIFAKELFTIGLIDRSADGRVLKEGSPNARGIDGCAAIAWSRDIMARDWEDDAAECFHHAVVGACDIFNPRYRANSIKLGIVFPGSELFT